jgi:26S proteasome regulatory subunit T1
MLWYVKADLMDSSQTTKLKRRRSHLYPMSTEPSPSRQLTFTYLPRDIQVLKTYGAAPYAAALKKLEQQIKEKQTSVNEKIGVKESDTGLAPPHLWDVAADRQRMSEEQPLQVARCTKIIQDEKDTEKSKYVINVKQIAKFVVNLGERVSPTDIEEGMRVG